MFPRRPSYCGETSFHGSNLHVCGIVDSALSIRIAVCLRIVVVVIVVVAAQIPYKMMDSNDPRRKKARDRQRSIERIRKKKSEWGAAVN